MKGNKNISFIIKVLLVCLLMAVLVYLLHPAQGQFTMMINGAPVADSVARFAALPTLLTVLLLTAVLSLLVFFGVGLFIFLTIFLCMLLGIFIIAPYAWPLLLVVFIIILMISFGEKKTG